MDTKFFSLFIYFSLTSVCVRGVFNSSFTILYDILISLTMGVGVNCLITFPNDTDFFDWGGGDYPKCWRCEHLNRCERES